MNFQLIAVSGIDGSGKSTQISLLTNFFLNKGKSVKYIWTRGGSTYGFNLLKSFLRKIAKNKLPPPGKSPKRDEMLQNNFVQSLWLNLAIFDLLITYAIYIRWHIFRNNVVIFDRYIWDTLIDFKLTFPRTKIENKVLWKILEICTPIPDKSILLIISPELSEYRCSKKYDPFPDSKEFRIKRYKLYEQESINERWEVIDSERSVEEVFATIIEDF